MSDACPIIARIVARMIAIVRRHEHLQTSVAAGARREGARANTSVDRGSREAQLLRSLAERQPLSGAVVARTVARMIGRHAAIVRDYSAGIVSTRRSGGASAWARSRTAPLRWVPRLGWT